MTRFLVAAVLAVCVSASYATPNWGPWRIRDECACDSLGVGYEVEQRECYGTDCTQFSQERRRQCVCGPVEPVLTPGEIAGIAVGSVVTLILLICLICWCCCCMCGGAMCGEECDGGCYGGGSRDGCMGCGGCGRWDSEEDLYQGRGRKVPMMTQVQAPMQAQPQQIVVTAAPQVRPQAQYAAVNFGAAVVQQAPAQCTYFVG